MEGGPQGLWGWKGGGLGTPSEQLGYLGAVGRSRVRGKAGR